MIPVAESNLSPITVLLVEDEPEIRRQQERLLRRAEGIELLDTAENGLAAVKKALELKPRVVLLDLGLPDIDGIEVTRRIKEGDPQIEILIFTIFDEEDRVMAAISAGAAGYILKGISAARMVEAVIEVASGGSVIQPHLARHLLRRFRARTATDDEKSPLREPLPSPQGSSSPSPEETPHNLTPREQEILLAISKGFSNREVASMLHLSMATVRTHLEHIYAKLDVTNRTEAVTEGYRKGIITLE